VVAVGAVVAAGAAVEVAAGAQEVSSRIPIKRNVKRVKARFIPIPPYLSKTKAITNQFT
jgi:hypothetical protein